LLGLRKGLESSEVLLACSFFCCIFAAWLMYQPALDGPFMLDDYENLGVMKAGVEDAGSLKRYLERGNAGPLGRPVAKLSFLIDDNAWPSSPESFKRTSLYFHLLTGIVLFSALRLLLRSVVARSKSEWLALLVMAFFLLHPLQVSTTMYVVQRMTVLSGLFVLVGVFFHVYLRTKYSELRPRELAFLTLSLGVWGGLSILSKESGALLPVFILIIELTILSGLRGGRLFSFWFYVCLVLPTLVLLLYIFYWPNWVGSYLLRDFTLLDRISTQPVVLVDYLRVIFSMRSYGLGLYHDDFTVYSSIWHWKPFLALSFIISSIGLSVYYRKKYPLVCFAVLWFFGGHLLESTLLPLEMYFEHRNYIPIVGPILVFSYFLCCWFPKAVPRLSAIGMVMLFWFLLVSSFSLHGTAKNWSDKNIMVSVWASEHPNSSRAQMAYAHLLAVVKLPEQALDVLDELYKKNPSDLSVPVFSQDIACFFDLPRRYDFNDLASRVSEHDLSNALRVAVKQHSDTFLDTPCKRDAVAFHYLMESILRIGKIEHKKNVQTLFKVLNGNLYQKEGDYKQAYSIYSELNEQLVSVGSALRLSGLCLKAKDFNCALAHLRIAEERNSARSQYKSSYTKEEFAEKYRLIVAMRLHEVRRAL